MPLPKEDVQNMLEEFFPNSKISIRSNNNDGNHYQILIISDIFDGMRKVTRHQMVYKALKGNIGTSIHAAQIKTMTNEESKELT